jgi:hypothetical protein
MSTSYRVSAVCSTFRRNLTEGDGGLARPDAPEMMCRDAACPIHGAPDPACDSCGDTGLVLTWVMTRHGYDEATRKCKHCNACDHD